MLCNRLAERISELDPELPAVEVARLCLLILNENPDPRELQDESAFRRRCKAAAFRLKAAADQHAAMSAELDAICGDRAERFEPDQIWTLVRALKVQTQVLDLYIQQPAWV